MAQLLDTMKSIIPNESAKLFCTTHKLTIPMVSTNKQTQNYCNFIAYAYVGLFFLMLTFNFTNYARLYWIVYHVYCVLCMMVVFLLIATTYSLPPLLLFGLPFLFCCSFSHPLFCLHFLFHISTCKNIKHNLFHFSHFSLFSFTLFLWCSFFSRGNVGTNTQARETKNPLFSLIVTLTFFTYEFCVCVCWGFEFDMVLIGSAIAASSSS